MCGWCGSTVSASQVTELQNGPTVLRLCPECVHTEQGRKMTAALPRHTPRVVEEDPDDEPRTPARWQMATALGLVVVLLLPLILAAWFLY